MEVLHSFKSSLLMYRVFNDIHRSHASRQRVSFAFLLLSSGGALLAYLVVKTLRTKSDWFPRGLSSIWFVVPLVLVAGFELLVDAYLLMCINAELHSTQSTHEPLLLDMVDGEIAQADGDEEVGVGVEAVGEGGCGGLTQQCGDPGACLDSIWAQATCRDSPPVEGVLLLQNCRSVFFRH
jgi:hypothetical protein